jgi:hypothetical protein
MSDLAEKRAAYQALRYAVAVWVSKDVHVYVEALEAEVERLTHQLEGQIRSNLAILNRVPDPNDLRALLRFAMDRNITMEDDGSLLYRRLRATLEEEASDG